MNRTQTVPLKKREEARKTNRAHHGEDERSGRPGMGQLPPVDTGPLVTTLKSQTDQPVDTPSDTCAGRQERWTHK